MPLNELTANEIAVALVPTTVSVISARDEARSDRVATIAWVMPISHEPSLIAVAIRPQGSTARAMVMSGCFVVNVLPATDEGARIARICGTKAGIDDRVAAADLVLAQASRVDAARIGQAVSWIECELVSHEAHGDHELFIGRTVLAETRGRLDEAGKLVPQPPLVMGQRGRFGHFEED